MDLKLAVLIDGDWTKPNLSKWKNISLENEKKLLRCPFEQDEKAAFEFIKMKQN